MVTYVSLLRGINVSGQKMIKMDALKKLYESLGFSNARTYIQSGNVVFESKEKNVEKIVYMIEAVIKKSFGFDVSVLIRTKEEIKKVLAAHPFAKSDPKHLYVTFLSSAPESVPLEWHWLLTPTHFRGWIWQPNGERSRETATRFL